MRDIPAKSPPPKYRVIHRLSSRGRRHWVPPSPSKADINTLLNSLQSVSFARYNEVDLPGERPRPPKSHVAKSAPQSFDIPFERPESSGSSLMHASRNPGGLGGSPAVGEHGHSQKELTPRQTASSHTSPRRRDIRFGQEGEAVEEDDGPFRKLDPFFAAFPSTPAGSHSGPASPNIKRVALFEPPNPLQLQPHRPNHNSDMDPGMTEEEIEEVYRNALSKPEETGMQPATPSQQLNLHQLPVSFDGAEDFGPFGGTNVVERRDSKLGDPPGPGRRQDEQRQSQEPNLKMTTVRIPRPKEFTTWTTSADEDPFQHVVPRLPKIDMETALAQRYHILGFGVKAKYLAHQLSGSLLRPPVHILCRDPRVVKAWETLGSQMVLQRDKRDYPHTRIIPEVVRSYEPGRVIHRDNYWKLEDQTMIQNLIVTAPARSILAELRPIAHRIDRNTTIVLIQDGLGLPELLNIRYFPDPENRPKYVEGHMSSLLYSVRENPFAVREVARGALYLSTKMKDPDVVVKKFPDANLFGPTRLLQSLMTVEDLDMVPCARAKFLFHKLPPMMLLSILEPLSTLLGGRYSQIPRGYPNNRLVDRLLAEFCDVVTALPEFAAFPQARRYFNYKHGKIRYRCLSLLARRTKVSRTSDMQRLIQTGKATDIMHLNGYFSKRAQEVGVRCPVNDMVINLIKSSHEAKSRDLRKNVRLNDDWIRSLI